MDELDRLQAMRARFVERVDQIEVRIRQIYDRVEEFETNPHGGDDEEAASLLAESIALREESDQIREQQKTIHRRLRTLLGLTCH